MQKPNTRNSSGRPAGTGKGKKIQGINKLIKGTLHGEDPKLIIHPDTKSDPEEITQDPNDEISRHQYPPPKKNPVFRKIWGQFVDSVASRQNFNTGYLNSLEILCDLFTEYEELSTFIRKTGRSYQSHGRSGMVWKLYPEVGQLKSVQHQINVYMKQLGLILKRDDIGSSSDDIGEWE